MVELLSLEGDTRTLSLLSLVSLVSSLLSPPLLLSLFFLSLSLHVLTPRNKLGREENVHSEPSGPAA